MQLEAIYRALPLPLQNLALSCEGLRIRVGRYNAQFWQYLSEAEPRLRLSEEELTAFRDARMAAFVEHAATTVPYYRDLFRTIGMRPGDIKCLADLTALPVLEKRQVQEAPDRFFSEAVPPARRIIAHTSGTTGAGLRFATTADAQRLQWATWWRYFRSHGIEPDTWCGYFGGRSIVPVGQQHPPFWRINRVGRQIMFSAYHASPENLGSYLAALRRFQPPWLHGYPSQIALVAGYLVDTEFDLGYRPRWVTLGAENVLASQAEIIQSAFGVPPIQHYGMAEAVANASQCPRGRLHVDEDFAALELLRIGDEGACRIVGTNFSNLACPLLRYDVGDHAVLSSTRCDCGRAGRVLEQLDGRQEDYVELANGARVGRLDHIFKDLVNIREAQIRQRRPGKISVAVVKQAAYSSADEALLREEIATRLGRGLRVEIAYVDKIERTASGKLRFVVREQR